jgi:tellurite resistance protein TehA-like permease
LANQVASSIQQRIKELYPGYFAFVMATGIVSIASQLLGMSVIGLLLLLINVIAYIILWLLYLWRFVSFSAQAWMDMGDHARGPGFFTMVAGTCVLGAQFVLLVGNMLTAAILWGIGSILWLLFIYVIFTRLIIRGDKPSMQAGINGAWLIIIVATQSISVLGTLLAQNSGSYKQVLLSFTLAMYLLGGMLYILVIALIFYRLLFVRLEPAQLTPPYWITMGAVAITTLAGDTLILNVNQWSFLGELLPFLKGLNLFFWATATWWIPLLVILGIWRHLYKHYPLSYDPQYWSMVFPLGMYTTCTFQLSKAMAIPLIELIPRYFIYIALAAWLFTFIGLVNRVVRSLFPAHSPQKA